MMNICFNKQNMQRLLLMAVLSISFSLMSSAQPRGIHHKNMKPQTHLVAQKDRMGWYYSDYRGRKVSHHYKEVRPFHEGLAAVRDVSGWRFIDMKGREVTPSYKEVYDFKEGLALVRDVMGWYFINPQGHKVGGFYSDARPFENGLAMVRDKSRGWHLINKKGQRVSDYHRSSHHIRTAFIAPR